MNAELTELISEQQMLRGKLSTFSVSPNTSTTPQVATITDRIEELSTDIAELRREQSNLLTSMPALKVSPFNTLETPPTNWPLEVYLALSNRETIPNADPNASATAILVLRLPKYLTASSKWTWIG
jgi:hypothetical protein